MLRRLIEYVKREIRIRRVLREVVAEARKKGRSPSPRTRAVVEKLYDTGVLR